MLVFLAQARSVVALSGVVAAMVVVVCVVASEVASGVATVAVSRLLVLPAISRIKTCTRTTPVLTSLLLMVA
jgi:hypothetical protein